MAGSAFGSMFRVTTWGEAHGKAIGAVVDGCPAGLALCEEDIQAWLDRRRPGQNRYTTARSEADRVVICSGLFEGCTTGTPISLIVFNEDQRSKDYSNIARTYRPGHADLAYDLKYGIRDYRGGGRSSGRETIGRVAGGAIAGKMLRELGVEITGYVSQIGPITCDPEHFNSDYLKDSPLSMPDPQAEESARAYLDECIRNQTSSGAVISCRVQGMLPGLGEPVFDKLDALIGQALFSIGSVKAVEIGDGCQVSGRQGHEVNDAYHMEGTAAVKDTNHAGGVYGGISDGSDLLLRVHIRPTPSIARSQQALNKDGVVEELSIHGRHDPIIAPRAVVVVEAMVALTLADLTLRQACSRMENLRRIYSE